MNFGEQEHANNCGDSTIKFLEDEKKDKSELNKFFKYIIYSSNFVIKYLRCEKGRGQKNIFYLQRFFV